MAMHDTYQSPLAQRYASAEMQAIWSAQRKHATWRRLWLALAEAQAELGLDIAPAQLAQLRDHLDDIDFENAAAHEARLRHDVMAHIHALGDIAPDARAIVHLGATSQFVNCNTELILLRDSLQLTAAKIARVIDALGTFAHTYRDLPTLGFTHYQPAQPTTVGKRATLWAYDLALTLEDIEHRIDTLRFRGVKGTTGTQASFLALFEGSDAERAASVDRLDELVTTKMGWSTERRYAITGQTYPRVVDAHVLSSAAAVAAALHKCATDIRLLANRKEIEEPFASNQVGSSAMAYKRNPMRCERVCGMTRFVMNLAGNAMQTAAVQWFERTLDDSSNRRLSLPEAFLALDGSLDVMHNVCSGLVVYDATIAANLAAELPFMASENLMMVAVQAGADRQEAHEVIRTHSLAAAERVKRDGASNDLLDRLRTEPMFATVDVDEVLDPHAYVGRAPSQVDSVVREIIEPIRDRYRDALSGSRDLNL
ncbi:MAG: adenylosuccinate lyase [Planctomycetota bacterium]